MTAPVLRVVNNSGGLVLSSVNSFGLNYIGKASQSGLYQASGDSSTGTGRRSGRSEYSITSVYRPVCFVAMPIGTIVRLLSVVYAGSNTWTLSVFAGTSPLDSDSFETQVYVDVYCFARPASHSGAGLGIWDDSGNLRWSITNSAGRPLLLQGLFDLVGSASEISGYSTIPSLSAPAILGSPKSAEQNSTQVGSLFDCRLLKTGWRRTSATQVQQADYFARRYTSDGGLSTAVDAQPCTAFIIDASGL